MIDKGFSNSTGIVGWLGTLKIFTAGAVGTFRGWGAANGYLVPPMCQAGLSCCPAREAGNSLGLEKVGAKIEQRQRTTKRKMKELNVKNQMKINKWTAGLAAVGMVSLVSAARADETPMSQVQTALSNTTLSGYVDTSAMWNPGAQNNGNLPAYTPGGVHGDGFNLNAVDLALDRPMDESPWAAGYHVELMFGQDSVGSPLSGGNSSLTTGQGATIRQAYLALRTPIGNSGIDWKVGLWDTIIGYESSSDPLNPNFTRSYGWNVEPTTHTGILGTYKANDEVSFSAGVANSTPGNASNGNPPGGSGNPYESQKAYMGSIALTAPDSMGWMKGATLNAGVINADNGSAGTTGKGSTWLYLGATIPTPANALKLGAAFDYVDYHNGGVAGNPSDDSVWVAGAYANYQFNDKLSFNVRGEFYDAQSSSGHTYTELTGTATYQLWQNVLSRAEIRWDKAGARSWGANSSDGPAYKNEVLLALNLIYQF